jgi:hypothetical protein
MRTIVENLDFDYAEIEFVFSAPIDNNKVVIRDVTYDNTINFQTLIKTEEQLLNLNPEEYGLLYKDTEINLGTNFGAWQFGRDTFGNKITVVKTEKLSGKGYNIKTTFSDFTKSKWTLETMGIAYRMQKARSNR